MSQITTERLVRRAAFDMYGRSMVGTIQQVDSDAWQITLTDGSISWASIQDDGAIAIDPA